MMSKIPETQVSVGDDSDGRMARIDAYLATHKPPTPCIIIDLQTLHERYAALRDLLPGTHIYYAFKANPTAEVIATLAAMGAGFDLASMGEITRCRTLRIPPTRYCFGNTIKHVRDIAAAQVLGLPLYAFDCLEELEKLARAAPGAQVLCRIAVRGGGADWPLTRKFGCTPAVATELLLRAVAFGLRPAGVSFHVGSQQMDPQRWTMAIRNAARVFRDCHRQGLELTLLNLGGGLPAHYRKPVPPLADYVGSMLRAIELHFAGSSPELMIEPGRYLVGDAGVLRTQVLLVARRGHRGSRGWIYLDAGRFNGLAETEGQRIQYPLRTSRDTETTKPVILAGPTCDSADVIFDRARYLLPRALAIGDLVDFLTAGAYTASYASVEFNGFPPLQTYCAWASRACDNGLTAAVQRARSKSGALVAPPAHATLPG